jgi:Ca-activated chloride channel homolog
MGTPGNNHPHEATMLKFMGVVSGVCLLVCWPVCLSVAQSVDVHLAPREVQVPQVVATADGNGIVDPELRTRTKPFKKEVELVLVPVMITDPMNRLVAGLEKDSFAVVENGQSQQIQYFSSEDAPISLGVIFDVSASMADKIERSRQAVLEFLRTANPDDDFFLETFSDTPQVLVDFTSSIEDIQNRLAFVRPKGCTSLLDAIYLAITRMRGARYERKALLIISDGGDNHSRYTEDEVKAMVQEADVQIYAMGLFNFQGNTPEELNGPELLKEITGATGGQTFYIHSANELAEVAAKIGTELRNQYVLGYRPKNPTHDGKWRQIRVKVNPPKGLPPLHVYAKTGYYAAEE